MILFVILTLTFTTGGHGGPVPKNPGSSSDTPNNPNVCPLQKIKEDFDMSKVRFFSVHLTLKFCM